MSRSGSLYLDTSVIIARYKPMDPLHDASERLFTNKALEFLISPITLFELYSVISRLGPNLVLPQEVKGVSLDTLVRFIIEDCNIRLISEVFFIPINLNQQKVNLPLEYLISITLAEKLKLRALDLLHIAYVAMLREKVKIFVTGDEEILGKKTTIKKVVRIEVKHPEDI